jgi:hypothetical protein
VIGSGRSAGLLAMIGEENVFATVDLAVQAIEAPKNE